MQFRAYAEIVLNRAKLNTVYGTWLEYSIQVEKDFAPLHDILLNQITEADCVEVLAAVKRKYSVGRHRKTHIFLNRIFREAIADGELIHNPLVNLKMPKKPKKLYTCYTASEAAQIVSGGSDSTTTAIVLLELFAGLRRGEVLALDWNSVIADLSLTEPNGGIVVHQTLVRADGGYQIFPTTKGRSDRYIPMNKGMYEAIRLSAALGECRGWLFKRKSDPTSPIGFEEYHRRWRNFVEQLREDNPDFRYLSPHKLRHTYASQMLASGVDIESLRLMMGHSDIKTTELYLHVDNERLRKCSESLSYGTLEQKNR